MQIDDLHELLDDNAIQLKSDKQIVENILGAERDWDFEIENLNEFIDVLEKEIGGVTTESNLNKKLKKYNQSNSTSWNSESLCYLIDIFNYSGYSNLKLIFNDLSIRLNETNKIEKPQIFKKKGYPIIKVYEDYFEIRAINFSEFRKFEYHNLKKIILKDPKKKWWNRLYISTSIFGQIFSKIDYIKLKVINKSKREWTYLTPNTQNSDFNRFTRMINHKIKTVANNTYK